MWPQNNRWLDTSEVEYYWMESLIQPWDTLKENIYEILISITMYFHIRNTRQTSETTWTDYMCCSWYLAKISLPDIFLL